MKHITGRKWLNQISRNNTRNYIQQRQTGFGHKGLLRDGFRQTGKTFGKEQQAKNNSHYRTAKQLHQRKHDQFSTHASYIRRIRHVGDAGDDRDENHGTYSHGKCIHKHFQHRSGQGYTDMIQQSGTHIPFQQNTADNTQHNADERITGIFGGRFVNLYRYKVLSVLSGITHLIPMRFEHRQAVGVFFLFVHLCHFHHRIVRFTIGFQNQAYIPKTAAQCNRYRKVFRIPGAFGQTEERFFQQKLCRKDFLLGNFCFA